MNSEKSIFKYYQKLIKLRHDNKILKDGSYTLLYPDDPNLFIYERELEWERWIVVANLSDQKQDLELMTSLPENTRILIQNSDRKDFSPELQPFESFIISY
ncbi:hypothetical protein RN81_06060 [Streptococcus anginosus]|uniref:alpha-glucosidase C-terminal domain-containing protein n=1 Tax=Streptococcus TaxID=1301 RepID=UPI000743550C|nr:MULTISPECIES: alpha-glucosidase C-terminal domain-containing protein [Streptococcus]KUM01538.1 hypothetical protein RN81_06060 [Streptococcus anginosus]OHS91355.1 hypothetical protein HMPREF3249_07970 [Streptococcus sp. HMSC36C04]